ncbi:MAG: ABC transporter permease [Eubacteriales bacterium]
MANERVKKIWSSFRLPIFAVALGFAVGAICIIIAGSNPLVAYFALFRGSLGSIPNFGETLYKMTPILFTGLSVALAFRCGLFNIGAEGQYIVGTITAVATSWYFSWLPGFVLIPLILLFGLFAGGIWGGFAGFLKAQFGVHEVITTIMMNYIALHTTNLLVRTVFNPQTLIPGSVREAFTVPISDKAKLLKMSDIIPQFGYSSAHVGIFIAIVAALAIYFLLFKTTVGYEIRSVGFNADAAEYGGISKRKNTILSMFLSGGLAGLGGAVQVTGVIYMVNQVAAGPGYGFTGLSVALVGSSHPLGVIASALLFGILDNGARQMQLAGIPKEVTAIIQAVILIFIAGELIVKIISDKRKPKLPVKEEE